MSRRRKGQERKKMWNRSCRTEEGAVGEMARKKQAETQKNNHNTFAPVFG